MDQLSNKQINSEKLLNSSLRMLISSRSNKIIKLTSINLMGMTFKLIHMQSIIPIIEWNNSFNRLTNNIINWSNIDRRVGRVTGVNRTETALVQCGSGAKFETKCPATNDHNTCNHLTHLIRLTNGIGLNWIELNWIKIKLRLDEADSTSNWDVALLSWVEDVGERNLTSSLNHEITWKWSLNTMVINKV